MKHFTGLNFPAKIIVHNKFIIGNYNKQNNFITCHYFEHVQYCFIAYFPFLLLYVFCSQVCQLTELLLSVKRLNNFSKISQKLKKTNKTLNT